jgi:hypothetical protein
MSLNEAKINSFICDALLFYKTLLFADRIIIDGTFNGY